MSAGNPPKLSGFQIKHTGINVSYAAPLHFLQRMISQKM